MKLIIEEIDNYTVKEELIESEGKKRYFIEGIFLQSSIKNKNGRIYPEHVMDREVARYNQALIKENRAVGELGHPQGPTINYDRVSHKIVSLKKEGTNYIGKALVTNTPMGKIVEGLLGDGVRVGVSSRGMGTVKPHSGVMEVQDDFYLSTAADIVADPSAPDAFVNGIMEGVEWIWDNGIFKPVDLEETVQEINQAAASVDRKALEEAQLYAFNRLLSKF